MVGPDEEPLSPYLTELLSTFERVPERASNNLASQQLPPHALLVRALPYLRVLKAAKAVSSDRAIPTDALATALALRLSRVRNRAWLLASNGVIATTSLRRIPSYDRARWYIPEVVLAWFDGPRERVLPKREGKERATYNRGPIKKPKKKGLRWTPEEDKLLVSSWEESHINTICNNLDRSPSSVENRARVLGLGGHRHGFTTLSTLARTSGYSLSRLKTAVTVLGLQLWTLPRTSERSLNRCTQKGLDQEGVQDLLDYLRGIPDTKRLYNPNRGRLPKGTWGGFRPSCTVCGRVDRPHYAKGRCSPCYQEKRKGDVNPGLRQKTMTLPKLPPRLEDFQKEAERIAFLIANATTKEALDEAINCISHFRVSVDRLSGLPIESFRPTNDDRVLLRETGNVLESSCRQARGLLEAPKDTYMCSCGVRTSPGKLACSDCLEVIRKRTESGFDKCQRVVYQNPNKHRPCNREKRKGTIFCDNCDRDYVERCKANSTPIIPNFESGWKSCGRAVQREEKQSDGTILVLAVTTFCTNPKREGDTYCDECTKKQYAVTLMLACKQARDNLEAPNDDKRCWAFESDGQRCTEQRAPGYAHCWKCSGYYYEDYSKYLYDSGYVACGFNGCVYPRSVDAAYCPDCLGSVDWSRK